MHVAPWDLIDGSYTVSQGYPGVWQRVSEKLSQLENQDLLPFITSLTFEAQLHSDYDEDLRGDMYTINMSIED